MSRSRVGGPPGHKHFPEPEGFGTAVFGFSTAVAPSTGRAVGVYPLTARLSSAWLL